MNTNTRQHYLNHLESVIQMYEDATQEPEEHISERAAYGIVARARTIIEKVSGRHSYYAKQVDDIVEEDWSMFYKAELIIGITEALRKDVLDGYLESLTELTRGELFNNFLDMSTHLLQEGYKDAAAVIAGSSLEAHLRVLCSKNSIDTCYRPVSSNETKTSALEIFHKLFAI